MSPDPSPIRVEGLQASYGAHTVFDGLSLDVRGGEIFGLIGLNGAGKTTLIRSMLGLHRAGGAVSLFGLPSSQVAARRNLVYLPEHYLPSPLLKGWEVLSLTLSPYGLALDRAKAAALCQGLDFDPALLDRLGRGYSKGMGQKLGLAAALLTERPLLILDEPMSGLDPRARIHLKDRLNDNRAAGRTVFFSSHILADVEELCDRIGVLHDGRLVYEGSPGELIARTGTGNLERAFLAVIGG
ncbi:MAG TPA: ABC transporter ATP-binding protein [Candidatus Sulfotelmatobacter sp.]|jgi:ABC-2 type transport system ATP-binding protein|nr:ABC transporter ATP-binding protein [Candidatus Sulfotelmatobacter sp.]